ncbi:uncharacterized protein Z519_02166 [Cladophialophora bantiana CBS 173.52]|uniref:EthD domain-containing protein n=1 Tax=Cladophialophora bantiana (strain ATCC 10958 / CBS 173.52 / CDC B-1940 / NIH 8579) TaxID=1442370 RepID=A0A0D2I0R5_CLAB1|nr:uncharacterized protein Z519_02166 [Cladophialophora bantiana CBS 173.52]KIW96775.1 hypothetical protein Z519_02166 [Cladophialophora bantiana CBS 173.52]
MPPSNVTVLYPTPDLEFDLEYYLNKHMPVVMEKWAPYGTKDWKVVKFTESPDGTQSYSVGAIMTFESQEHLKKALAGKEVEAIFGDITNFSNKYALFLMSNIVEQS